MYLLYVQFTRVKVCRVAAAAVQNLVVQKRGREAVDRVVAAIVDTGAVNLRFTNMRYHVAKYFGYVLPTKKLVGWMCDQYNGNKYVTCPPHCSRRISSPHMLLFGHNLTFVSLCLHLPQTSHLSWLRHVVPGTCFAIGSKRTIRRRGV